MKIILLEKIEKIGKKYEVKDVKAGFFRNWLLPNKLAKPFNKDNALWLERNKEIIKKERNGELQEIAKKANYIKSLNLVIFVKVGDKNQLFEKITKISITKELNSLGDYDFNKNQILLIDPIKKIGNYNIEIALEDKATAFLNLEIKDKKIKKEK